ncbi:MAG: hypothetical protein U0174_08410 [Polyangiaceae bacterium]
MRAQTLFFFLLSVSCASASTTTPQGDAGADAAPVVTKSLGMSDVSVLWPLPASPAAPGTLGPESAGAKGTLLPQAVYDKVPAFGVKPAQGLDYARMRVVATRFDGCFSKPSGCEAQIRLVMQPITDDGSTLDSALHLFYTLTETELTTVVAELRRMRTLAPEVKDAPLDVHAGLAAQGLEGAYGKALRDLVLAHAGEENLTRMTFFLRAPPRQEEWFLGGVERVDGVFKTLDIVGVGKANQRVNRPVTGEGYTYTFTPEAMTPEDIGVLLDSEKAKAATPEARSQALSAFARIENPNRYGPDQLPCAGCHVSTFVTEATRVGFGLAIDTMPDAFKSQRDLTRRGEAASTPSSLRAFGYFDKTPMIGSRVVHESAVVVDDLEKRFPMKK